MTKPFHAGSLHSPVHARIATAAQVFRTSIRNQHPSRAVWAALILLLPTSPAGAAAGGELRLKDGSVLRGEIISREDSLVVFRTPSLGEIRVPVSALADSTAGTGRDEPYAASALRKDALREAAIKASGRLDPSDHALFFLPTAFTPERGSFMFRDFELLFLTLGFAPTASTTITGGFLFPITPEIQLLTAGFKQRLWSGAEGRKALALTGNFTRPLGEIADEIGSVFNSNLVFSARFPASAHGPQDALGFHAALGALAAREEREEDVFEDGIWIGTRTEDGWDANLSIGMGFEVRATEHSKFMAEFLSAAPFDDGDAFGDGIFTLGFRLHGFRLAADIAGIRPLTDDDLGSFFLWPLLVVSYRI